MLFFDRATDLQRALYRIFRAVMEDQRHAIAGREFQQSVFAFLFTEFVRRLDNLIQLFNGSALIVARHLGIGDDVDEENVRDLERDLLFNFSRHKLPGRRFAAGKFLETWIVPERIEHGIEPEQRGSERYVLRSKRTRIGYRE